MIRGLEHVGSEHKCTVCSCDFTDDEGGVQGYFGILPVAFCPTCYSSMYDMVQQDMGYQESEYDGQPTEQEEWASFDPDC